MNYPDTEKIIEDLNYLYFHDIRAYKEKVETLKGMNFKIYRNTAGEHKVKSNIMNAFGGIFGDIFGGY